MKFQINFANNTTSSHFAGKEFDNKKDAKKFYKELADGFKTNQDSLAIINDDGSTDFESLK